MIPAPLCLLLFQVQSAAALTLWGLKTGEWLTIAAIIVGPFAAVATQLWIQHHNKMRDQKLWVYGALMSCRATWIAADFVRAMNFIDVVFYKSEQVRAKRAELMAQIKKATGPDGALVQFEWDRAVDFFAEMLDLMGKELGFDFEHTQIKDTAYYPVGHEKLDKAAFDLREKGLAVLEGRANIGVVVHEPPVPHALRPPR